MEYIEELWQRALRETEIIRSRISPLHVSQVTDVYYILLSESTVNPGDTVVRKGHVSVHEPSLLLPPAHPIFEGFDFEQNMHTDKDAIRTFLLLRGVTFPSLKYNNEICSLDIFEGSIEKSIKYYSDQLEKEEDVKTGLIVGGDEYWQFSVLIFIGGLVVRNATRDAKKLLEKLRREWCD
jgi:hypothetical protein